MSKVNISQQPPENTSRLFSVTSFMVLVYVLCMSALMWVPTFGAAKAFTIAVIFMIALTSYVRRASYGRLVLACSLLAGLLGAVIYRGGILNDFLGATLETGIVACPLFLLWGSPDSKKGRLFLGVFLFFVVSLSLFFFVMQLRASQGRQELAQTNFMSEVKSPKHFKVQFKNQKWKVVAPGVAEKIFSINTAKADLVFVSEDARRYGLVFATLGNVEELPDSRQSILNRFQKISKGKSKTARHIKEFETKQGVAVSGTKYVMGKTFDYVGFRKQLPGMEIELILGSPYYKAIELFEDLEALLGDITSAPVRKTNDRKTAISIYDEFNQAVVLVQAFDKNRNLLGFGTGFNVSPNGLIVTNLHVLAGGASSYIIVKFPYHGEFQEAVIAGVSDPQTDLALLEIRGNNLPAIDQLYEPEVEVGEKVFVIGNPQGLINTLSPGIISGIRDKDGVRLYQITAPISGGSSGGPVFNEFGEVICVASASHRGGQNLNFCISIDQVDKVRHASDLQSGRVMQDKPVNAKLAQISARQELTDGGAPLPSFEHPGEVKRAILYAIDEGAALFNQGDTDRCFQVYDLVAKQILYTIDPTDDSKPKMQNIWRIVNTTRQVALRSPSSGKAAWVLRYGFDIILKRS